MASLRHVSNPNSTALKQIQCQSDGTLHQAHAIRGAARSFIRHRAALKEGN